MHENSKVGILLVRIRKHRPLLIASIDQGAHGSDWLAIGGCELGFH
jgi:hypothetical protein